MRERMKELKRKEMKNVVQFDRYAFSFLNGRNSGFHAWLWCDCDRQPQPLPRNTQSLTHRNHLYTRIQYQKQYIFLIIYYASLFLSLIAISTFSLNKFRQRKAMNMKKRVAFWDSQTTSNNLESFQKQIHSCSFCLIYLFITTISCKWVWYFL